MISGSCGVATNCKRVFLGKISARKFRGFSYCAKRLSISHDSSPHVGGDQRIARQCTDDLANEKSASSHPQFGRVFHSVSQGHCGPEPRVPHSLWTATDGVCRLDRQWTVVCSD